MVSIIVKKDSNLLDIEGYVSSALEGSAEVWLPNSLKDRGVFGVEASVVQFITTWVRIMSDRRSVIRLYGRSDDAATFSPVCEHLYGLYALSVADDIIDSKGAEIKRRIALMSAVESISKIRSRDFKSAFKGGYVCIPSITAPGYGKEFDNPFYSSGRIISPSDFVVVVGEAIGSVLSVGSYSDSLSDQVVDAVSGIVGELYQNTHDHGRTNGDGDILDKNIRSVTFCFNRANFESAKNAFSGFSMRGLQSVIEWSQSSRNVGIPLLEISIVDGGQGFARSWLKKPVEEISFQEESKAVLSCFQLHKSSTGFYSRGMGLFNVMSYLKSVGGFFRLTTGRVRVEKSFTQGEEGIQVGATNVQEMGVFLEGSAISIIIPLRRDK